MQGPSRGGDKAYTGGMSIDDIQYQYVLNRSWNQRRKRAAEGQGGKGSKRARKFWAAEEEKALREGVQEFGSGKWLKILHKHKDVFKNRNSVDLKDKWRNMVRQDKRREDSKKKPANHPLAHKPSTAIPPATVILQPKKPSLAVHQTPTVASVVSSPQPVAAALVPTAPAHPTTSLPKTATTTATVNTSAATAVSAPTEETIPTPSSLPPMRSVLPVVNTLKPATVTALPSSSIPTPRPGPVAGLPVGVTAVAHKSAVQLATQPPNQQTKTGLLDVSTPTEGKGPGTGEAVLTANGSDANKDSSKGIGPSNPAGQPQAFDK
eukprot:422848-Amorphochlora_amoeboformis.AAC.4